MPRKFSHARSGIQPKPLIELFPYRAGQVEQLERIAAQHGLTATKVMMGDVDKYAAWYSISFKEAAEKVCRSIQRTEQPGNAVLYPEKKR